MIQTISNYKLFLIPVIVLIISQFIKMVIEIINGKFSWKNIGKYGGMPSSHTAFVVSLVTLAGLVDGINSLSFSITFVLATLIIRDATGLRHYLSNHSKVINLLIEKLPDSEEIEFPHIEERLGHTTFQVLNGFILGLFLTILLFKLL
jgi:acid phosphatase family membrane protein YuiD